MNETRTIDGGNSDKTKNDVILFSLRVGMDQCRYTEH